MLEALEDDLNTPAAISELHSLAHEVHAGAADPAALKAGANLMGLLLQTKTERDAAKAKQADIDVSHVQALVAERASARVAKNWAESDRLRADLAALGVAIKDNKDGTTTWEPKR